MQIRNLQFQSMDNDSSQSMNSDNFTKFKKGCSVDENAEVS